MTDLLTITTQAELERLAQQMHEHVQRENDVAETHVQITPKDGDTEMITFQIILRPAPGHKLQLCTVGHGRHWPHERRAELCAAFGVPDGTVAYFDIIKGWQIIKWTWTRQIEQLGLALPGEQAVNNYEREG